MGNVNLIKPHGFISVSRSIGIRLVTSISPCLKQMKSRPKVITKLYQEIIGICTLRKPHDHII
uniref:Uncharacterized protein n=1 Tax=Arundo donax TaxID=35708 RepID=A0A0A9CSZ0_ARUDO